MVGSLGFVEVRTTGFAEITALDRDVLGLEPIIGPDGSAA
jgi:hypothetical protein